MGIDALKVPPERLTSFCDPDSLGFETTDEIQPLEGTVGQDRAVGALEFGLSIDVPGYNIYVVGFPGTGRTTTLEGFLRKVAKARSQPDDWCYVHNFHDPLQPIAVRLPAGMGRQLVEDIDELIRDCSRNIPRVFESADYRVRVDEAMGETQQRRDAITQQIESTSRKEGFAVQPSSLGLETTPLKDGRPLSREEYNQLPDEERDALRKAGDKLQQFINEKLTDLRQVEREAYRRRIQVDKDVMLAVVGPFFNEMKEKYQSEPNLVHYLDDMREDIASHMDDFRTQDGQQPPTDEHQERDLESEDRFLRYRVNVLVDHGPTQGAPVIIEYSPTYYNLFGRVEYRHRMGAAGTDLTMIRPGAIHLANGGYLAIPAKDLLDSPLAWDTLKRVLRSGETRIENIAEQFNPIPTSTLRPQPIPVAVKIVLIGTPILFSLLQRMDEDFRKLFKVKADFDISMERNDANRNFYASFVHNQCRDGNLRPFHKTAVSKIIDYASRLVEHQERLSTRFIDIADLTVEAEHWAGQDGDSPVVMDHHVGKAIKERIYRSNLTEERVQQYIDDGTIMIDTEGSVVGQINGISVLDMGDYAFGRPVRITARSSMGRGNVTNIDREAQMTGRTHNKGFLILTGYLMGKYGQDKPLPVRGTIGFEQTYDEVDGDSASSAELYALLSSLGDIPIKQGIAVTGSVNQRGEIQAIGGATHKIEGFFEVCKSKGLTGDQGVIIPKGNVNNLILNDEVTQAVKDGRFTVYAVESVEQGMEVLTGVPTGEPDDTGDYSEGTLNYAITQKLERLAAKAKDLSGDGDGTTGDRESEND